jgi:hypothetical protein
MFLVVQTQSLRLDSKTQESCSYLQLVILFVPNGNMYVHDELCKVTYEDFRICQFNLT